MHYQNATLDGLLKKIASYNPNANIELIKKAHGFAEEKTSGIEEVKGKPLMTHLLNSAQIAADLMLDDETIAAALIHDTPFKGKATKVEIEKEFGKEIANLVEELLKVIEIEERNIDQIEPDLLSAVILGASKDIRSIFLELAARTEVLRAIEKYPKEKQQKIANQSLKIYARICHKLGLEKLEWELEDLSLKVIDPQAYNKIKEKICTKREVRENEMEAIKTEITGLLKESNFTPTIQSRVKNFFGIYKKLQSGKTFSEINDLRGIRIICSSIKECYEILGILHSNYAPIPKEFHDYIANPKQNGYRSIHTGIYWKRKIVEIQIRTWEMHHDAETGVSAHWKYKKFTQDKEFDKKLSWAKQLVNWKQMYPKAEEFIKSLKIDFGEQKTFVFTPKKQIVMLPESSTPVDFAFSVHSDLGFRCRQAKINGRTVQLNHHLNNGDTVEIITGKQNKPKRQWLNFVKLQKAKTKIKRALGIQAQATPAEKSGKKSVKSTSDPTVKIAQCCTPLPSDEIIGYKTTKRKTTVHRKDCRNILSIPKEKLSKIEWNESRNTYYIKITISAMDRAGLLNDILNKVAEAEAIINMTHVKVTKNNIANCEFSLKIKNPSQVERILKEVQAIPGIYTASRR